MAQEECSAGAGVSGPDRAAPDRLAGLGGGRPDRPARTDGTVLRLSTDELVRLAPRLRPYLATPTPTWPAVVDAADWLRSELNLARTIWGLRALERRTEERRRPRRAN